MVQGVFLQNFSSIGAWEVGEGSTAKWWVVETPANLAPAKTYKLLKLIECTSENIFANFSLLHSPIWVAEHDGSVQIRFGVMEVGVVQAFLPKLANSAKCVCVSVSELHVVPFSTSNELFSD